MNDDSKLRGQDQARTRGVLDSASDFDEQVFYPLMKMLREEELVLAALDTETQQIDADRGFNPFYGVRMCMGSISWNTRVAEHDYAWNNRMETALLEKPMLPTRLSDYPAWLQTLVGPRKGDDRSSFISARRRELSSARRAWLKDWDLGHFPDWYPLQTSTPENIDVEHVIRRLDELTRAGIVWVMKNAKFDMLMLWADGMEPIPLDQLHDAEIMSHLTEDKPWQQGKKVSHKLQELAERHLGRDPGASNALEAWFKSHEIGKKHRNYACAPANVVGTYAWQDTRDTLDLFYFFDKKMDRFDDDSRYSIRGLYRSEMELIHNLVYGTIIPGLPVDQAQADATTEKYSKIRDELTLELRDMTGEVINWSDSHQVVPFLFHDDHPNGLRLKMPPEIFEKKGYSADKWVLAELDHPVPDKILEWRKAHYMVENFLGPIARFNVEGFIHPDFWLTTARTGRMSCTHPNMQNRPKDKDIREVFVPRPGYVLVASDLDQIEMRVVSHYAQELVLACPEFRLQLYWNGRPWKVVNSRCHEALMWEGFANDDNYDPHNRAVEATGLPRNAGPGEKGVKVYNFQILYGGGVKRMAHDFGWTKDDAKKKRDAWKRAYPEIAHLMNFITKKLQGDEGFLSSVYGRRYYIDADKAYLGLNYITQGTAADLIKRGLVAAFTEAEKLQAEFEGAQPVFIDNVVHDEVIFEVREDLLSPALLRRLVTALTTHKRPDGSDIFNLPITAGCKVSDRSWGHVEDYDLGGGDVSDD